MAYVISVGNPGRQPEIIADADTADAARQVVLELLDHAWQDDYDWAIDTGSTRAVSRAMVRELDEHYLDARDDISVMGINDPVVIPYYYGRPTTVYVIRPDTVNILAPLPDIIRSVIGALRNAIGKIAVVTLLGDH